MSYVEAQAQGYFAMGGTTEAAYIFNDGNALFDVCKDADNPEDSARPHKSGSCLGYVEGRGGDA
jgi:4-hydroxybenzoate polyprenyltransferase